MKKIRKFSRNPLVLGIVAFSLLFLSCSPENDYVNQELKTSEFTGEKIFGQIFFLDEGGISSNIPAYELAKQKLNSLTAEEKLVYSDFKNGIIKTINELDGNFFNSFKTKMTSKDPYQIKAELKSSAEMLHAVINIYLIKANAEDITDYLWSEIKKTNYDLTSYKDIEKLTKNVSEAHQKNKSTTDGGDDKGTLTDAEKLKVKAYQGQCITIVAALYGVVALIGWIAVAVSWVYIEVSVYGDERLLFDNEPRLLNDQIVYAIVQTY